MWTDFTASFLFRGASRSSTVGRKNSLSIGRATMRSISRTLIELSWNLSIEPDRAHGKTLEELSGHGDSTRVSLSYVSAIARTREKKPLAPKGSRSYVTVRNRVLTLGL